jgi:type II secretory pathway component PulJ
VDKETYKYLEKKLNKAKAIDNKLVDINKAVEAMDQKSACGNGIVFQYASPANGCWVRADISKPETVKLIAEAFRLEKELLEKELDEL